MIVIENFGNEVSPLKINKELLFKFKEECDIQLSVLHRELTRALVDYKLFQQLQLINNDTFKIIDSLDNDEYTTLKEVNDDRTKLIADMDDFLSHCKHCVASNIYDPVYEHCNDLSLIIFKLVQILTTINI